MVDTFDLFRRLSVGTKFSKGNRLKESHSSVNTNIQFTKEIEENGKIPFLDCLVTRENNTLRTTVYRKPTHIDRLLDQTYYNPTSHKATTVRTLTRRAQIVCDSDDSLTDEIKHLNTVFIKNNYNTDFIERNTYNRPNDSSNNSYTTTATIPYVQGPYIGETGRNLTTRLTEHKRATKKGDLNNNIAEHHLKTNHAIDWDSATCLTYSTDYYQQITLESWFTNLEQTALNRCQPLPAPYKRLLNRKQ
ncbi:hypothetical protein P5673_028927 [Acropora cervicornis]|uniref:Helix-turn-helix domain-containing protein n=1 Tax=Acropora cervicornis TaxID=6130 RepID=A0AAD9PWS3_ACRCE|nr:hypothetical protein P5673_028927 [Acropora cervicornis]